MAFKLEKERRFPRIKLSSPLRYQIRGTPEFNETVCDNISVGGMSFINHKFIAPKTPVAVEINVLSRILRPIGRIAWSLPLSHSDRYRSGVEFLEVGPRERDYLSDYIDMRLGKI